MPPVKLEELVFRMANGENRCGRSARHVLRHAPEQCVLEPHAPVGTHNHKIAFGGSDGVDNRRRGLPAKDAALGGNAGMTQGIRHMLQPIRRPFPHARLDVVEPVRQEPVARAGPR